MPLWNPFRKTDMSGEPTAITTISRRLQQRREGYKESLQQRADLMEKDTALLQQIAARDAHLDVATAGEQEELRREQELLRQERQPIRTRLEEIESSLPQRVKLIQEDEYLLEEAKFRQKVTDRETWLKASAEDRKLWEDCLNRFVDLTKKMASWEVINLAAQHEVLDELAPKFGMAGKLGNRWEAIPSVSLAREALATAWNESASARETEIRKRDADDLMVTRNEVLELPRVPITDGAEMYTSDDHLHTWESVPLKGDAAEACTMSHGCHEAAVVVLKYQAPQHAWMTKACKPHAEPWIESKIRSHQHRLAPR